MSIERACRTCHTISAAEQCPQCGGSDFSKDYLGYVIILDVEKSLIAQKMEIDKPGKYALKVR